MKTLLTIIIFVFCSVLSYSQSKTEFGLSTEGGWFTPRPNGQFSDSNRNGWGTGIGVYASRNIFWRFSADIGLSYRYKQMQQHYMMPYTESGGVGGSEYPNQGREQGWKKYNLSYIVLPVHLQLLTGKYFFVRGGIESTWLTNYDNGIKKTEYNWTVGWGSQKYKLKWSVNYIRGFKGVGFYNGIYETEIGNVKYPSVTFYRNQMIQLSLSYPIWQKK